MVNTLDSLEHLREEIERARPALDKLVGIREQAANIIGPLSRATAELPALTGITQAMAASEELVKNIGNMAAVGALRTPEDLLPQLTEIPRPPELVQLEYLHDEIRGLRSTVSALGKVTVAQNTLMQSQTAIMEKMVAEQQATNRSKGVVIWLAGATLALTVGTILVSPLLRLLP
jgi:hypothetical protein